MNLAIILVYDPPEYFKPVISHNYRMQSGMPLSYNFMHKQYLTGETT